MAALPLPADRRLDVIGRVAAPADLFLLESFDEGDEGRVHLDVTTATAESEDQVKGRFLLNVVVGQGPTVLELLSGEDQPLLIGGNAFLVLDLDLDVFDRVRWLHVKGDRLTRQSFNEDLHDFISRRQK